MAPTDEVQLIVLQLKAVEAWNRARGAALHAQETAGLSRELRLDLSRRMDVLREQHRAILHRADVQLHTSVHVLASRQVPRAVVAHRNEWFKDKVCTSLAARGVEVVAGLTNGAETVGCVVAEQPDLLLVEDVLSMVSGAEVVRDVREFAPGTRIGAHAENESRAGALLDAGAHAAWTRRVPPAEVADGLLQLLQRDLQHA